MHSPHRALATEQPREVLDADSCPPVDVDVIRRTQRSALAPGVHLFPHQRLHCRYHIGPMSRRDSDTCRALIHLFPGAVPLDVTVSLDATLRDVVSFLLLRSTSAFVYGDGSPGDMGELAMCVEVVGVKERPGEVRAFVDARDFLHPNVRAAYTCSASSFSDSDRNIGELLTMTELRCASVACDSPPLLRFHVQSSACRTELYRRAALEAREATAREGIEREFHQSQRLRVRVVPHELDVMAWHEMKGSTSAEGVSEALLLGILFCAVLQAESPLLGAGEREQWEGDTLSAMFISSVDRALASRYHSSDTAANLLDIPLLDVSAQRLLSYMPWWPALNRSMQSFALDSRLLHQQTSSLLTQLFVSHCGVTEVLDGAGTTLKTALVRCRAKGLPWGERTAGDQVENYRVTALPWDAVLLVSVMPLITRHRVRLRTFAEASESATIPDASDASLFTVASRQDELSHTVTSENPQISCSPCRDPRYRVAAVRAVWEAENCFSIWLRARLQFSPAWRRDSRSANATTQHLHVPSVVEDYLKSLGFECYVDEPHDVTLQRFCDHGTQQQQHHRHHVEAMVEGDSAALRWQAAVHREAQTIADSLASDRLAMTSTPAADHVQTTAQFICSLDALGLLSTRRYPGMDRGDCLTFLCRDVHHRHKLLHCPRL